MSKEERTSLQSELAAALAAGKSCAEWASAHGVSERTARRWATDPEVRAEVENSSCSCGLPPGECREHPRGRPSQRPPAGDWRVWGYVAGRGAGKTRAGACWMQHRVEAGVMKLGCLIAPTMADIRDVMVEGPSGLLAVGAAVVPASIRVRAGVWLAPVRPLAEPPGLGRARGARPAARIGQPVDPPAVHAAESRVPDVQPPAPPGRVDRLPGRWPSRRRLDRCAPRRCSRRLPRRLGARAQAASGPCFENPGMSATGGPARGATLLKTGSEQFPGLSSTRSGMPSETVSAASAM